MRKAARRCSSCTTSIPRRKLSTVPSPPGVLVEWARRSSNWTSFSSPWARAWDGHEVGALEDGASLRDRDDRERLDASRCPSLMRDWLALSQVQAKRRKTKSPVASGAFEEREKGFERSTLALARRCSTTELFPHGPTLACYQPPPPGVKRARGCSISAEPWSVSYTHLTLPTSDLV